MVFYDKNGNIHTYNIEENSYIDKGLKAKIYRISDTECIKVLNCDPINYFDEEVYNEIKSLSLNGLVKLGIPFYTSGMLKDYTMEYLEKSKSSILDMPTEYTLDNINSLYKSLNVLADNSILVQDLIERNLIVGNSKVTLIDLDNYKKSNLSKTDILYKNTWYLLFAFKRLYQAELIAKGYDLDDLDTFLNGDMTLNENLTYLFDYNGYKEEPAKVLEKEFKGTKTPMELFTKK